VTDTAPERPRWENRITRYEPAVDPEQLLAHPENWRCHPKFQSDAMRAALDEVGWIDAVTVNERTGHVIDGHLRVGEAISADQPVPVLYVDVDVDTERKALATFDTITGLAQVDRPALAELGASIVFASDVLTKAVAVTAHVHEDPDGGGYPEPDPNTAPLVWGYVQWGKRQKIDSTEAEVTAFDALYDLYRQRNDDSDIGFLRWIVDGQPELPEPTS
jgi:hypothetical protein